MHGKRPDDISPIYVDMNFLSRQSFPETIYTILRSRQQWHIIFIYTQKDFRVDSGFVPSQPETALLLTTSLIGWAETWKQPCT